MCLTADAWSSSAYKGYIVITDHCIDSEWELQSIVLDLLRFSTPHTGEEASSMIFEAIEQWNLVANVLTITTDNASDMCAVG